MLFPWYISSHNFNTMEKLFKMYVVWQFIDLLTWFFHAKKLWRRHGKTAPQDSSGSAVASDRLNGMKRLRIRSTFSESEMSRLGTLLSLNQSFRPAQQQWRWRKARSPSRVPSGPRSPKVRVKPPAARQWPQRRRPTCPARASGPTWPSRPASSISSGAWSRTGTGSTPSRTFTSSVSLISGTFRAHYFWVEKGHPRAF